MVHVIDRKKPELASDFRKLVPLKILTKLLVVGTTDILT